MLYAGEDPRFIFRRMIIFAGEDIGLADPHAIQVVVANAQAFDYVGLPEGRFHLSLACLYLATAPKSNTTLSFFDAIKTVGEEREDEVPNHLKDSSRDRDGFGHGEGYLYPHAFRDHWIAQQYLPDMMQGKMFVSPVMLLIRFIRKDKQKMKEFLPYIIAGTCFAIGNSIVYIAFKFLEIVEQLKELNEQLKKNTQ